MITKKDIEKAHQRIASYIHRTPVLSSTVINEITGAAIQFKCENFQKVGAFKARGALNAILQIDTSTVDTITTHSSGNHGQAVAYAAREKGFKAVIVMSETAPEVKKKAVLGYGAEVVECAPTLKAREENANRIVKERNGILIHPFDNDQIIAGQATAGKELIEYQQRIKEDPFDFIITPVGGGGLLSGTALSTHYFSPGVRVIGAEPEGAADAVLSFKTGKVESAPYIDTIADGLLTTVSERTLTIIRKYAASIKTVSDAEIIEAMRLIWERMKIIVEPSSATALAIVLKQKKRFAGKKIGIILTGGNVDLQKLPF